MLDSSMSARFTTLDFADIPGSQAYDVLVATVHPRPIAFVSSISGAGHLNLAPFSFFMVGGSNPPSLVFSPTLSAHGPKDTLRNIEETGEFVVNLVHREIAHSMNLTAKGYPHEISEWEKVGLSPLPSQLVKPPRVAESLVHFECRLFQIVSHGDGAGASRYVIGEVLAAHLAEDLWDGQAVVDAKVRPIARMGGPNYLDTAALEFFEMKRPV
ncbi:MAG: flavin reductase family protein [Chlorobia bacterium]|nr:flavin reductase family protein [Fimbriimonadaceae bacterium]